MKAERINPEDYVYVGEGANGQSFNHRSDPSVMMKLYNQAAPFQIIGNELTKAREVYKLGVPCPKPGRFVTDGIRYGILFQRIEGKKSFSRAIADEPSRVEEFARRFARMCLNLHSIKVPRGVFPDIKTFNMDILSSLDIYTDDERRFFERAIENAPDGDTAIHGDLQFSNAIVSSTGEEYFIDLGDFACGSPLFDLGMVLFTCIYDDKDFIREVFHLTPELAASFWKYFVKEYFGESHTPESAEKLLRPYAALKLLIIERNAGLLDKYHYLLK